MRLTIGQLAKATGTKVETIRYYERIGLLAAQSRTSGNYRSYEEAELNRLSFIRRARELGFSLDQVRELISLSEKRDQSCLQVDILARRHLDDVQRKIDDLEALRRELTSLLGQCKRGTISDCLIIEALRPGSEA